MLEIIKFKEYLESINFGSIGNYISYLNSLLPILNKLNKYENLTDEEKIIQFSEESNDFKDEFNRFHNYNSHDTFNDFRSGARKYVEFLKSLNNNEINKVKENKMKTKNIMLYGAPGVGKTHNYKRLITMIENRNDEKTIFDTISKNEKTNDEDNKTFQNIKDDKRIEFVTFHQSYSYEDFIEGFRPSEEDNKIVRKDGVFKIISDKAKNNLEDSKKQIKQLNEEKTLYQKFQEYINDRIQNNKKLRLQRGEEFYFNRFEEDRLYFKASEKSNVNEEFNLKYDDFVSINSSWAPKQTLRDISNILGTNSVQQKYAYYLQIYYDFVDYVDEYHIINGEEPKEVKKEEQKNFYIVIDEINRGNISKIFGELITLIEEDKRDSYEVTLPYSKEKFKIPSNLFIIATMNSTDKSIATIDIALRRRFTFLKMEPKESLVEQTSIKEAKDLFTSLNKHISKTINEDYQLGHSYFMNINSEENLEFVKRYKIQPLLEEYFYGDDDNYTKAIEILGIKK